MPFVQNVNRTIITNQAELLCRSEYKVYTPHEALFRLYRAPFHTNDKQLKMMTDFKAKMWLLHIFLKKFILHLKQKGLGLWYIGNVLTTVIYIFFGVSSDKNVNTVINNCTS